MSEMLEATTARVAGETNYLMPLAFGLIAALIVIGIIYILKIWHRRRNSNESSSVTVSDLPQHREEPSGVIISSSWSSGEDNVYYPEVPTRFYSSKSNKSAATTSGHPVYKAHNPPSMHQTNQLSTVLPEIKETHFCPHSRQQQQHQQEHQNIQFALHSTRTRPKPLTPPPSNMSTPTVSTSKTYDSARSITPQKSHYRRHFGNKIKKGISAAPSAPPPSEQRSEDINEQSSTANMMAMNKMSKEDAKRMRQKVSKSRPTRPPIRRPLPVSAEAITAASTSSNEGKILPSDDLKDPRQHLYSQEHVVDYQKNEPMLKSDITQNDETVEMPIKKK